MDAATVEAVRLLQKMRTQARQSGRVRRPILRRPPGVGLRQWLQDPARRAAASALVETRYYRESMPAQWVLAIDRASATLEAQP